MARLLLTAVVMLLVVVDSLAKPQDSSIVFEDTPRTMNRYSSLQLEPMFRTTVLPECASAFGLGNDDPCTEDTEYNNLIKDHVQRLLRRDSMLNELVKDPVLSIILNDSPRPSQGPKIPTLRVGSTQESPVCQAQETIIYPMRGKTPKNDWVFVVNQQDVEQAIKVEKCIKDGSNCNFGMPIQGSTTAVCRQKYVYKRMLIVGSNAIEPEEVLMPSCCVCYLGNHDFDIHASPRK